MLEKIKQFLNNWAGNVREYWDAGYRFRAGFTFIVPPILVALTIILLFLGVSAVFDFLRRYYAQLFFMAVGICIFVAWLDKRKADNLESGRTTQTNLRRPGRRTPHMLQGQKSSFHVRAS